MAFDLNKNDGLQRDTSKNTQHSSSKFDLSKGDVGANPMNASIKPRSPKWTLGIVAFLIVAGGIWIYAAQSQDDTLKNLPIAASANSNPNKSTTDTVTNIRSTTANVDTSVVASPANEQKSTIQARTKLTDTGDKAIASFAQGSSVIGRLDQSLLKSILAYLTENPTVSIVINGYASSDGPLSLNKAVSQARADSFKDLLISRNVPKEKLTAVGRGIENPIATNSTSIGRRKNRRVEVSFQ